MTILTIFIFLLILILLLIISLIIINSTQFSHKVGGYRGGGDSDDENDIHFLSAIQNANGAIASPHTLSSTATIMSDSSIDTNKLIEQLEYTNSEIDLMKKELLKNESKISDLESNLSDSEYSQNKLQNEIEELQSEIAKKEQIIKSLMNNAKNYNSKSTSNRDLNYKEIQGFRDKIQELQSVIAEKEQTIESLMKHANDYNSKSTDNRDTIRNLKRDNEILLESMKTLKDDKEKIISFLQASLENINNINSKLETSNSAKQDMIERIKKALEMNSY